MSEKLIKEVFMEVCIVFVAVTLLLIVFALFRVRRLAYKMTISII